MRPRLRPGGTGSVRASPRGVQRRAPHSATWLDPLDQRGSSKRHRDVRVASPPRAEVAHRRSR
jgi:hypothetical protein